MNDLVNSFYSCYNDGYYEILGIRNIQIYEDNSNIWKLKIVPNYGKLKSTVCNLTIEFTNFPNEQPHFYPDGGYKWTREFYKRYVTIFNDFNDSTSKDFKDSTSKNFKDFFSKNFNDDLNIFLFTVISNLEDITKLNLHNNEGESCTDILYKN